MSPHDSVLDPVPRRQALCGILALGLLGVSGLAGCADGSEPVEKVAPRSDAQQPAKPSVTPIALLSKIPVGGGTVVTAPDGRSLVITQPSAGTVVAYDASCTHQGIPVGAPDKQGVMTCVQHNSKFQAADGAVVNGPATTPLTKVDVKVQGDHITLA